MDRFFLLTCVAHPIQRTVYTCLFIIMKSIQNTVRHDIHIYTQRYCHSVGAEDGVLLKNEIKIYTYCGSDCMLCTNIIQSGVKA